MQIRRLLLALVASTALAGGMAFAEPPGHGNQQGRDDRGQQAGHNQQGGQQGWQGNKDGPRGDVRGQGGNQAWGDRGHRDWRDDRGNWHKDRDRYWRQDFGNRGFMGRDRIFMMLRQHNYNRFAGDPYWFQGRYVVKTYDRRGRMIFVEINPYTGAFIGIVRF
jgi:hypothetical protein